MKNLMLILSVLFVSLSASANFYPPGHGYGHGHHPRPYPPNYTPHYPGWQQSMVSCQARTVCPNGRAIWCQTYGMNWGNIPSYMNNSCQWRVIPGRAVQCNGYVQQRDYYGRLTWAYVNIPVSCY